MRYAWASAGVLAVAFVAACAQNVATGRNVYDKHCVTCHGAEGRGDGDFSDKLLKLPPDLTVLARENGGEFPRLRVTESIVGTGRGDHFSGAMPAFADVAGSGKLADYRLEALLNYLEAIQQ